MIKAASALIAWNYVGEPSRHGAPAGAVAVGPLIGEDDRDWSHGYDCTGGASWVDRRKMFGMPQQFHVMRDWYELVYGNGIHPYVAHRAFLMIEEYQAITKDMGMGPAPGELGHDPNIPFGRSVAYPVPEIEIHHVGASIHVWPVPA